MGSETLWSAGRYDAVGDRIASIATQTVAAADRRMALRDGAVVDLACGTGNAALAAAAVGARVTGVDLTPELIALGTAKARAAGHDIAWVAADAAETGLPAHSFDAAISNMGIIFVDPRRQVTELRRLLKSGGVLAFSSWVRMGANPFFDPIIAVLGTPPATGYLPDQWGDPDTAAARLAADFDGIAFEDGTVTWEFASLSDAVRFLTRESPMHVDVFSRLDGTQRELLTAEFESAWRPYVGAAGAVAFDAPYVVITAQRN